MCKWFFFKKSRPPPYQLVKKYITPFKYCIFFVDPPTFFAGQPLEINNDFSPNRFKLKFTIRHFGNYPQFVIRHYGKLCLTYFFFFVTFYVQILKYLFK